MWCNLRKTFSAEIAERYWELRKYSATRSVNLCFDDVENRFQEHQSKWPENLFNKDSQIKYIDVLTESGQDYLEMLQGDKAQQRKWWLNNRFKYFDSKYLAGDARTDIVLFRAYGYSDMEVTPFADTYITVSFANSEDAYVSQRATKGVTYTIKNPLDAETYTDQETHIFAVSQLKSLGDLSAFKPDTIEASSAIHLQELKIGDGADDYNNPNLTSINVTKNTQLQYLDVRHCSNLAQTVDVSNCSGIETVWCEGSSILGVTLPDAGILKSLHLPNTITKLIIKNHPLLTDLVIENIQGLTLSELWIENMKNCQYDVMELVNGMAENSQVRLIDINQKYNSVEEVKAFLTKLDTLKGTDAQGRKVDVAQVQGKIHINAIISYAEWKELQYWNSSRYSNITITANVIRCTVNFYKTEKGVDPKVLHESQLVEMGKGATRPTTDPTKDQTAEHVYTFSDWDPSDFSVINEDTDIYPVFKESVRYYTVTFDVRTTKVTPPLPQKIEYNGKVIRPTDPKISGATFLGWYTEDGVAYQFLTTPVVKDFTLYAKWSSDVGPSVTITKLEYNQFQYTLEDDVAIYGYAITNSAEEPEEWILISPTSKVVGTYDITYVDTFYVWALDENDHTNYALKKVYEVNNEAGEGTVISIMDGTTEVRQLALEGTDLCVSYSADEHYDDVKFYYNGQEITDNPFYVTVNQDCTFSSTSTPKTYTVKFDVGLYGVQPPDQIIAYNRTVEQPPNQFVSQRIIEGWYTSQKFEQESYWDFSYNTVKGDMTLYANWIVYMRPSIINVTIGDDRTITCYFDQRVANGVEVNWGDGTAYSSSSSLGVVGLNHTYSTSGSYEIQVTCKSGSHYLGGGQMQKPVIYPSSTITSIEFAWNMQYTSQYALYGATNLTDVSISKYMTEVALGTFQDCTGLQRIVLPSSLVRIGANAFYGCTGLTGIFSVPDSVTSIGSYAFYRCTGLVGFVVPETVKSIGESAFANCTSLANFGIPSYMTSLPNSMFANCTALTSMVIPETVETMGTNVFQGCSNLSKVIIMNENLTAGEYCFQLCMNLKTVGPYDETGVNQYDIEYTWKEKIPEKIFEAGSVSNSAIEEVVIADTIKTIGTNAFARTPIKYINFPVGLETIKDGAFFQCYQLTGTVDLPSTLKTIGTYAFYYCSNITKVNVPFSVTTIGTCAFSLSTGLRQVNLYNTSVDDASKVTSYTNSWFYLCASGLALHIPKSLGTEGQAEIAYGSAWRYYNSGMKLTYTADLE